MLHMRHTIKFMKKLINLTMYCLEKSIFQVVRFFVKLIEINLYEIRTFSPGGHTSKKELISIRLRLGKCVI